MILSLARRAGLRLPVRRRANIVQTAIRLQAFRVAVQYKIRVCGMALQKGDTGKDGAWRARRG
jgi:hypothetical protein